MLGSFRSLSAPARLLVINQFGVNVGFNMVLPFLAVYMGGLGYAAATIGFVLAARNLSQQGMFLPGGSAADRFGCRPMIILGCGLRVVAFSVFALLDSLPGLVLAAMLTGLSGAFFNPAVRTYLGQEAGERRAEAFAVFNTFHHAGSLVGPLLGAALLTVDFRLIAIVASVVFAVLTMAQLFFLPANTVVEQRGTVLGTWWEVVSNRRFAMFAVGGAGYFALYNQLFLLLPLEAQRVSGVAGAVGAVFVVSTVIGILGQIKITEWCRARWSPGRSMAIGLATMGAGFLPVAVSSPLLDSATPGQWTAAGLAAVTPVLIGTVVLTVGMAITNPFAMALMPIVGSERLAGTYFGFYYLISAVVVTIVSTGVGALLDITAAPPLRWLPALALAALGAGGAAVIAGMQRRGALGPQPDAPVK